MTSVSEITYNGDPTDILSRGIYLGTNNPPTAGDRVTIDGTGPGLFNSQINDLACSTKYYVRAYLTTSSGTTVSNIMNFTTPAATIFIPDAFSPNGDNIHDTWMIYGLSSYCNNNNEMYVFNQAGTQVFHSTSYHLNWWNGKVNNTGSLVPVGTYYYVFYLNGSRYKSATVFVSY